MREKILVYTKECCFLKGIKGFSIDQLARDLGIAKKTIYNYFYSKENLIEASLIHDLELLKVELALIKEKEQNAFAQLVEIVDFLMKRKNSHKLAIFEDLKRYSTRVKSIIEDIGFNTYWQIFENNIIEGQAQGIYKTELSPEFNSFLIVESYFSMLKFLEKKNLLYEKLHFINLLRNHAYTLLLPQKYVLINIHLHEN
ncbi:MAG: TetR/AcrR family transcriptional regulator [Chitinophagales bacterium]|jgi:AcrR family transcriptional regulator|nr:TetR/AcrR family transcriptional regulator [Chitinophagales bacterium]